jgi:alpha-beta hydrolase superfamily lysophospholipase
MAEFSLDGRAGNELHVQVWETDAPRAVIVLAHGYGEHIGRYGYVAARLNDAGYLVVGADHQGHGRSGGRPGQISFEQAVADVDTVVASQAAIHPQLPVVLLGHSMGGGIALRYALAHPERLDGLILSGPLVWVDANPLTKIIGSLIARVCPRLPLVELDPALVSRDPEVVEAYKADPLVRHKPIPAGAAAEFVRHANTILDDAEDITLPTLLLWGTADGLCPPVGARTLADALGAADLSTRSFDGLYHEIFNEPERDVVLDAVVTWLALHVHTPR